MPPSPYTTRILPLDEWHRLAEDLPDSPLLAADLSQVYGHLVVLERDNKIVGHWPLFLVWHAEPLYLAPSARTRGGVRALTQGLHDAIAQFQIPMVFALIEDEATADMACRLGFQPSPAPVYTATGPAAIGRLAEVLADPADPSVPLPQESI